MLTTAPEPPALLHPSGEQRVIFHHMTWDTYLQMLALLPQSRNSRLTYDYGILEITMPLEDHEFYRSLIEYFIRGLVELMDLPLKAMGSTTLNYPHLEKGAEPDSAYYIQNQPLVKGRNVDFANDPPPDLVVEVDITHTDIQKNQFYAALGVPEFWRFNGKVWHIYVLRSHAYIEVEQSPTFPDIPKTWLYDFLATAKEDEIGAMRSLRKRWNAAHPA
ncbi:Uma2 family endonuclease [Spirulina major CS-329]|jgi:Uma2 family endonuclease|uniref:Uma2 family endonuclease n=1 Tax=Spirulina TaxID=1154 RepID=UPI00232BE17F|nr:MULTISPECIES: Uma2 family endonuclease [Spirulina]MDB9494941.1 Uma2 family endonuclease [Spirulina subsalsa CS-330]MDB9504168.1 Uma2 family endonuclease [Spirulina major CS-329]